MQNLISILEQLGLEEKQAKVYLAALELGQATVHELAEKSGVKRTSIYNFLEEMKSQGLLLEIEQKNKTVLVAEDPNNVKKKIEDKALKLNNILPDLMGLFNLPGNKPKVKYYESIDGLKTAYYDTISHGGPLYGFAEWGKVIKDPAVREWLWEEFADERTKRKVKFFAIAKNDEGGRMVKNTDKKHLRETRLVKDVNFDTEINMYGGNRVALLSFRKPYSAVIVEDVAIYNTLLSIWKLVWNGLK